MQHLWKHHRMQLSLSLQSNLQNWPRAKCGASFFGALSSVILLAALSWLCEVLGTKQIPHSGGTLVGDVAKTRREHDE